MSVLPSISALIGALALSIVLFPGCGDDESADADTGAPADSAEPVDTRDTVQADTADTSRPDGNDVTDTTETIEDTASDSADTASDSADTAADALDADDTAAGDTAADAADTGDGGEAWDFDVPALLEGAQSDVPDEVMNRFPALFGGPMTRHSMITGVEFHIPGVISSERMSPVPVPLRKKVNGVEYWQVSGEISSRNQDDWGTYYAIGPIDERGVNHRFEPLDPFDPTEDDPDDPASHPRASLPGAIFVIRWPVEGFNGGIVQMQAAGDAGRSQPQALMAWWPIDPLVLMERGFAVASVAGGGTVRARKNDDGSLTIDTNPESGSDIFFTVDWDIRPWADDFESDHNAIVPSMRAMQVDPETFEESLYPSDNPIELVFPYYDPETDTWGQERVIENITPPNDPVYTFTMQHFGVELVADAVVMFKNFMRQASSEDDTWACYLGWSGSGATAWSIATGTQHNGEFQFESALGMPPSGGNFNRWRDPSSGVRFDAFLIYGAHRPTPIWTDTADLVSWVGTAYTDPEYPLSAPFVFVRGDSDVINDGRAPTNFWANATIFANAAARAWPTSRMADRSLDDYLAIYELDTLTHQVRDQLFTAWDREPFDEHAVWYDPALGMTPEAMNTEGRGLRMSEVYARQHLTQEQDDIYWYAGELYTMPRITPLMLSLVESLRSATEEGMKLPVSRVGPHFASVETLDAATLFPRFPVPDCEFSEEASWEEYLACSETIDAHSSWSQATLFDFEVAAVHWFITDNPLSRVAERLVVPDVAAPLGWYYVAFGASLLRRDFTAQEMVERYGDPAGYVEAFAEATRALGEAGFWDAALGQVYLDALDASDLFGP